MFDVNEADEVENKGSSRKKTQLLSGKSDFYKKVVNRAHVTYHGSAALWKHRDDIKKFVELLMKGKDTENMVKLLNDLMYMKVPLADTRALGFIKACVTSPFQAAFDKVSSNILDMVLYCIQCKFQIP